MTNGIINNFFKRFFPPKKVGLALSGGVARGIAHIGVLKVLKKHKIPIDYIAGASAGSMVGAFFAAGMDPEIIEMSAKKLGWFRFLRLIPGRQGPLLSDDIKKFVVEIIGDKKFSDLKIPLKVTACDLMTGMEVVIENGKVAAAVAASCAFPGIFSPVEMDDYLLADGGIANNLPSSLLKDIPVDMIIGVDVVPGGHMLKKAPQNAFQFSGRALDLILHRLSDEGRKLADVLIEPEIPEDIWQLDVDETTRLIKCGEEAAERKILEIKAKLALT